jgi:hypothetical protein
LGSEESETALCLHRREIASEGSEDILHVDHLEVNLFLFIEVLSLFIFFSFLVRL